MNFRRSTVKVKDTAAIVFVGKGGRRVKVIGIGDLLGRVPCPWPPGGESCIILVLRDCYFESAEKRHDVEAGTAVFSRRTGRSICARFVKSCLNRFEVPSVSVVVKSMYQAANPKCQACFLLNLARAVTYTLSTLWNVRWGRGILCQQKLGQCQTGYWYIIMFNEDVTNSYSSEYMSV